MSEERVKGDRGVTSSVCADIVKLSSVLPLALKPTCSSANQTPSQLAHMVNAVRVFKKTAPNGECLISIPIHSGPLSTSQTYHLMLQLTSIYHLIKPSVNTYHPLLPAVTSLTRTSFHLHSSLILYTSTPSCTSNSLLAMPSVNASNLLIGSSFQ